jgi:4-amino-4-deoxy-L-arabinose transferase-like glycosyltransferase
MTLTKPDESQGALRPSGAALLLEMARRLVDDYRERAIVAWALATFSVLWTAFHTISLWPVALRDDAAEAAVWAQHFALGYKHPPLTAWLFSAWFAVFPRTNWAMHLNAVLLSAIALAVAWRLNRDYLDKDKALFGLAALILVPLYTFKTAELNANTAMLPLWPAALLFYLRARRGLGLWNSVLAGACASAAMLAKYWAVYLFAGMAVAAVIGVGTRRFWRSPAPYLMVAGAALVIAPHLYWYVTQAGGNNHDFDFAGQYIQQQVMTTDSFGASVAKSANYLLGLIAYAAGPLLLLAALRPSRAALADIVRPADADRQQALILFAVPMLLPAFVNLVLPYRLTPDWTLPSWALLPIVLYGSRKIAVDAYAAAGAGLLALAVSVVFLLAAPFIAYVHLKEGLNHNRPSSDEIALTARRLTGKPVELYWGSPDIVGDLPFYVRGATPLNTPLNDDPFLPENQARIAARGLLIACLDSDAACRKTQAELGGGPDTKAAAVTISRTFLGVAGPPIGVHIAALPAQR